MKTRTQIKKGTPKIRKKKPVTSKNQNKHKSKKLLHALDQSKKALLELTKMDVKSLLKREVSDYKRVPVEFADQVRKTEHCLRRLESIVGTLKTAQQHALDFLNCTNPRVYMPEFRMLLRHDMKGNVDLDACVQCDFRNRTLLNKRDLRCEPPTLKVLKDAIKMKGNAHKILIQIRQIKVGKDRCKILANSSYHANMLVIDTKDGTIKTFDPNGLSKKVFFYYKRVFGKLATKSKYTTKLKYTYVPSLDWCGFRHSGLCRYSIIPTALNIDWSVLEFTAFVTDVLRFRLENAKKMLAKK